MLSQHCCHFRRPVVSSKSSNADGRLNNDAFIYERPKTSTFVRLVKRSFGVTPTLKKAWSCTVTGVKTAKAVRWNRSAHQARNYKFDTWSGSWTSSVLTPPQPTQFDEGSVVLKRPVFDHPRSYKNRLDVFQVATSASRGIDCAIAQSTNVDNRKR